ncbi:proprotein convertase subtilisin/kexin type 7 [Platysternon megacephalum]|uniref:Proprotein convertase subtilisin/kexin type 7 n=1 Tax=Platysternon megacephalum TaxID=55544 RepID=A0A4D9E7Z8_9SAUR|nr:proprotein convertase subtilisin/kexin type 7 [Platysternon megacephalum]
MGCLGPKRYKMETPLPGPREVPPVGAIQPSDRCTDGLSFSIECAGPGLEPGASWSTLPGHSSSAAASSASARPTAVRASPAGLGAPRAGWPHGAQREKPAESQRRRGWERRGHPGRGTVPGTSAPGTQRQEPHAGSPGPGPSAQRRPEEVPAQPGLPCPHCHGNSQSQRAQRGAEVPRLAVTAGSVRGGSAALWDLRDAVLVPTHVCWPGGEPGWARGGGLCCLLSARFPGSSSRRTWLAP